MGSVTTAIELESVSHRTPRGEGKSHQNLAIEGLSKQVQMYSEINKTTLRSCTSINIVVRLAENTGNIVEKDWTSSRYSDS